MRLASSLAKTTSAWTAGAGGALDTGTIVINTWYHWFVIMNVTSGAVDVLCSTSPTTPTLPSGYTLSRRIGSACTNGSSQWFKFFQSGDDFVWDVPASIYSNGSNPSTTVTLNTGTPLGVSVLANLLGYLSGSAAGNGIKLYETRQTNSGVSPSGNITSLIPTASGYANITALVRTDVTSQITMVATTTGMNIQLVALGWTDTRGRVA
jgi:hypothetical protein